jgi:hypothetical protein
MVGEGQDIAVERGSEGELDALRFSGDGEGACSLLLQNNFPGSGSEVPHAVPAVSSLGA